LNQKNCNKVFHNPRCSQQKDNKAIFVDGDSALYNGLPTNGFTGVWLIVMPKFSIDFRQHCDMIVKLLVLWAASKKCNLFERLEIAVAIARILWVQQASTNTGRTCTKF
jgi:hypothetical protein